MMRLMRFALYNFLLVYLATDTSLYLALRTASAFAGTAAYVFGGSFPQHGPSRCCYRNYKRFFFPAVIPFSHTAANCLFHLLPPLVLIRFFTGNPERTLFLLKNSVVILKCQYPCIMHKSITMVSDR